MKPPAITAEYSGNGFLAYILFPGTMPGMQGERYALLPLAIPHGVRYLLRKLFYKGDLFY
jgi:hypothetical protein